MVKNVSCKDVNLSIWHIAKIVYVNDDQLFIKDSETNLILRNRNSQHLYKGKFIVFNSRCNMLKLL